LQDFSRHNSIFVFRVRRFSRVLPREFLERASDVFKKGTSDTEKELEEKEAYIADLERKVGQLTYEVDWLKKKSTEILGHDFKKKSC
jgi:putative transposase